MFPDIIIKHAYKNNKKAISQKVYIFNKQNNIKM